ncbi:relaxase/mobilization nuclease domain-containing protein [Lactococcus formosensis]|uniref:relaxase/mobilization nuclease domain-containing protein n=1 Tax=Lactococcus TaxID=1357 RepID=UPI0024354B85|nr:relaxase/mobilization nuclease domain-containing protein [Lactococcus formosensis]MDG6154368.1 relaxase/mobilization nuclease domain-containing protein [Lactococcus formosensis]MDG6179632.1 relaxase/mobilization nuclease domain-containing protein [Lactococcus formosensis]MDG6183874.1 relaxase/mobilization nuclease domain-containing protein [Lactococcus formosensis]
MVVVPKPKQIKSEKALKSAVKYILNPQKTDEQVLTSGFHINNLNFGDVEMGYTRMLARKMVGRQNKQVLAQHLVQSFRYEDGLSAEEIHQIGREWIEQLTGGKHEYIIATHIDKGHIHNVRPDRVLSQVV